jgi:hypothetical protein
MTANLDTPLIRKGTGALQFFAEEKLVVHHY